MKKYSILNVPVFRYATVTLVLTAVVLVSGCATTLTVHLPQAPRNPDSGGTIFIERANSYTYATRVYYIGLNGMLVAGLKRNEYTKLSVDQGLQNVEVQCLDSASDWALFNMEPDTNKQSYSDWKSFDITVNVQPGSENYIYVEPGLYTCASISMKDQSSLTNPGFVEPGEVSSKLF